MAIEIGSDIEGQVTGITNYGAFVSLPEGATGLVHISQIADNYVKDINQHLKIGDVVKVKVLKNVKPGKYDLSIKLVGKSASAPPEAGKFTHRYSRPSRREAGPPPGTFEHKITQFLKDSEEKLQDWKKNLQYKQDGRKKKKKID